MKFENPDMNTHADIHSPESIEADRIAKEVFDTIRKAKASATEEVDKKEDDIDPFANESKQRIVPRSNR